MVDVTHRLSALDSSFLYLEDDNLPLHVGTVMIFEPPADGFDYDQLVELIAERIVSSPRYRQRVQSVPARLANPVWVDDDAFDVSYHVRRAALPRPGDEEQLEEFVARITSRPLDRGRPLWEVYFVEGLSKGRFAIVTKAHQALVDGINAVDISHMLLDTSGGDDGGPGDAADRPPYQPSSLRLVADAMVDAVRTPTMVVDNLRGGAYDLAAASRKAFGLVSGVLATLAQVGVKPAPDSPLQVTVGAARRFDMVRTDLRAYRTIRTRLTRGRYVEDVTINDVVLATITGALRTWLQSRGEHLSSASVIRAMVPVSVYDDTGDHQSGARVTACFVDLPVGEPNPSMRLHQIAFSMRQQMETTQAVDAASLSSIGGFAPPTLHSLGSRTGAAMTRRLFNLAITNVPGPQQPLYAGGARLLSTYPVMPLTRKQALAIGLTSYDGQVYLGLNADRDAMTDLHVLADAIHEALAELGQSKRSGSSR